MGLEPSTRLAKVLNKEVMFQHCHLFQPALRTSIARRFEPPAAALAYFSEHNPCRQKNCGNLRVFCCKSALRISDYKGTDFTLKGGWDGDPCNYRAWINALAQAWRHLPARRFLEDRRRPI